MKKKLLTYSILLAGYSCNAHAAISIDLTYSNNGITASQQAIFDDAVATWESKITGYQDGVLVPNSISIDASAVAIDGVNGVLGSAGPTTIFTSGGFTFTSSGEMEFDTADMASLEANGTLYAVILHEIGHVLGIGTLWDRNGLYTAGSGQYTGANGLFYYQRDFDPTATFVPVELEAGPGSDDGHWNEQQNDANPGTGLTSINPSTSYFGLSLDDELLSFQLSGSTFISDLTMGSFIDMGYTVNLDVSDIFYWDAGDPNSNGSIDSADGTWDLTTANWANESGSNNFVFSQKVDVVFADTGATVTLADTLSPSSITFDVDGYTLTGSSLLSDGDLTVTVTNASDTATFDTTISGSDNLILNGMGTVSNTGSIALDTQLQSGTLTNNGTGTISGDVTVSSGALLNSDADGLADTVTLNNSGITHLSAADTISSYTSSGGTLAGSGTLTASDINLSNDAMINANVASTDLNVTAGNVFLNGVANSSNITINSGAQLNVASSSINNATTAVTNRGGITLSNGATVGSFNGAGGTLNGNGILTANSYNGGTIETYTTGSNTLSLLVNTNGGNITLGANNILRLGVSNSADLEVFNAYNLINTSNGGTRSGGFAAFDSSLITNPNVKVIYNIATGQVYLIGGSTDQTSNTDNKIAVLSGVLNASFDSGEIFTNIDDISLNSVLLLGSVLNASANSNAIIEELSPEAYGGIADYGIRSHLSILDTALDTVNVVTAGRARFFAGVNSYSAETESSLDNADFDISSQGGYAGASFQLFNSTNVGIIGAAETGDLTATRLDLESTGTMVGIFTETELNMPFDTGMQWGKIRTSLSYSDHSFDGSRSAQGLVNSVDDINSSILQLGVSYKAELINGKSFKVSPVLSAQYVKSSTDSFTETNAISNLTTLSVDAFEKEQIILSYGASAVWTPINDNWGIIAAIKAESSFGDDSTDLTSSFAAVGTEFEVVTPGISELSVYVSAGIFFNINEKSSFRVMAHQTKGDDYQNASGINAHYELKW